jgi:hypothetical protein
MAQQTYVVRRIKPKLEKSERENIMNIVRSLAVSLGTTHQS